MRWGAVVAVAVAVAGLGGCGSNESGDDRGRVDHLASTEPPHGATIGSGGVPVGRSVRVERVVDGDTIVVDGGERVRLIGIDTPESVKPGSPVECFGKEASRYLETQLPVGSEIVLVGDVEATDRYDRTLAYVYRADGEFVNALLVAEGYALAYTVPPNVAHAHEFVALQRTARAEGLGLWSKC